VISEGIPAWSVLECFDQSGAAVDLLKLGITYPLPSRRILEFLRAHDEVLILEELDRIIETEIKALAFDHAITTKIHTKPRALGQIQEYDPHRTYELLSNTWPEQFPPRLAAASPTLAMLARIAELSPDALWANLREVFSEVIPEKSALPKPRHSAAPRLAQMCPGCGHRSAFFAIQELLREEYPDAIVVGDIGCHTLGSLEPYEMGSVLLSMGHSNGTAAGLDINNSRPVVTFIGDSTLYHAGLPAIANATMHHHNITLVVLENYTTAMTGHQPTAGSGEFGQKLNIPDILSALGVQHITSIDAFQQDQLKQQMRDALAFKGFSVVIAKHPCMLKFLRDKARKLAARQMSLAGR
jgi:indolepyruvate ferredoxin oxidoreductase alpha subunit